MSNVAIDVDESTPATPLLEPSEGTPRLVTTPSELETAAAALANGVGPTAVDAERAGGYRYGHNAYLVQLRRAGAGTHLIDPTAFAELRHIGAAIADSEWILHAASQDLPCLAEAGLVPRTIFDTEVAARILGKPRVGLAALVESELGYRLAKEHSAADWSTRPLPAPWLSYAALDVELLIELRAHLQQELIDAGRREWATEEFEFVRSMPARPARSEPWRRTSGIHRARSARQLAVVRGLWLARDRLAAELDRAPGRVLPDRSIVAAALAGPQSVADLAELPEFSGRGTRRRIRFWWDAVAAARELAQVDLPDPRPPQSGLPPPKSWSDKNPAAAARLSTARAGIASIHEASGIPVENLLAPEALRQLCWDPPLPPHRNDVEARLAALGARRWQVALCAEAVWQALIPQD